MPTERMAFYHLRADMSSEPRYVLAADSIDKFNILYLCKNIINLLLYLYDLDINQLRLIPFKK
jgi:hypothetical protein